MRKLFSLFFICCALFRLNAQQDTQFNIDSIFPPPQNIVDLAADTCLPPTVVAFAPIYYTNKTKIFLTFEGVMEGQLAKFRIFGDGGAYTNAQMQQEKLFLPNLLVNQKYELVILDQCGNPNTLVVETTNPQAPMITVSDPLYNKVVTYLKNPNGQSFDTYINGLASINSYEKLSLIQQFFFRGEAFTTDAGLTYPPLPVNNTDSCFCNMIRTVQAVNPGFMDPDKGIISEESLVGSGPNGTPLGGDSNTSTWYWINNKGAGKWHNLYTQGFGSKKGVDYTQRMGWTDSTFVSSQQSRLRMVLVCMDGDRVPQNCACEKDVIFSYRYDTRVTAVANVVEVPSWMHGSRNAISQVEDIGLSFFMEENVASSFKPLKMVVARADAHCDRSVNGDFYTGVAEMGLYGLLVVGSVVSAALDSSLTQAEIQQINTSLQAFFTQGITVLNTTYFNPTACQQQVNTSSMEGVYTAKLRPNSPIVFGINSFDKLLAGGRRAWHSYARVNSGFYLTGIIKHNATDGTPRHCCSPRVATWVLGTCDGPLTTNQLKNIVQQYFYTSAPAFSTGFVPSNTNSTGLTMPYEFGWIKENSSIPDCNNILINNGKPFGTRSVEDKLDYNVQSIRVFDIAGRCIATMGATEFISYQEMLQVVRQKIGERPTGVYILHIVRNGQTEVKKVFIN